MQETPCNIKIISVHNIRLMMIQFILIIRPESGFWFLSSIELLFKNYDVNTIM